MTNTTPLPSDYSKLLERLKHEIRSAQIRAHRKVNTELLVLYWKIGKEILDRQEREGWGSKVITRLADDLRREFPDMTGLSSRNLHYMRSFACSWPEATEILQRAVAQLPWVTSRSFSTGCPIAQRGTGTPRRRLPRAGHVTYSPT